MLRDPNSYQLLADETRRRVIYLLRAKEMTVSQIASEMNLTPQAIYHHIRKMKDAEMVEVAREERIDHFIETYYRATAELFHIAEGEEKKGVRAEEQTAEALRVLQRLGFDIQAVEETAKKLVALDKKMKDVAHKQVYTDQVGALDDVDFFAKQGAAELSMLVAMTDEEFDEMCAAQRERRRILKASISSGKARPKKT